MRTGHHGSPLQFPSTKIQSFGIQDYLASRRKVEGRKKQNRAFSSVPRRLTRLSILKGASELPTRGLVLNAGRQELTLLRRVVFSILRIAQTFLSSVRVSAPTT